jgi:plasmanylethanolamine desaturase
MFIALQIILGWYVADLITGIYHFFIDNFGSSDTPIFGNQIKDFQIHHHKPTEFLKHSNWESLKLPLLGSMPLFALAFFYPYFFIPLAIGIAMSQLLHKWAHMSKVAWPIKVLQTLQLIISPEEHDKHHTTFNSHYGIVNGWSNDFLNLILPTKTR